MVSPLTPEAQIKAAVKGLKVTYYSRWRDPKIAGFKRTSWTPKFVMLHHTAGTNSYAALATGAAGDHKPVPGSGFLVKRDGSVKVLSKFITYHAGKGGPRWGVAANLMNPVCWGIEIEDLGKGQTMTAAQINATAKLAAGLLKAMGVGVDHLVQHKAWSTTGKVDTRYSDAFWRAHVKAAMDAAATQGPTDVAYRGIKIRQDDKHPVVKVKDLEVEAGKWTTFATDWIPASKTADYALGMQLRRPEGCRVQLRVVRIGWGAEATETSKLDGTFYEDEAAQPYASSHTYGAHHITGGGPIAFQVLAHGDGKTVVPTLIAKVKPVRKG